MNVNTDQYEKWAVQKWFAGKRLASICGEQLANEIVASFGVGGEAGEFSEKMKKQLRGDDISDYEMIKELGDILYYITMVAHFKGYSLHEVFLMNVEKLNDRFARDKQRGEGDNR